MNAAGFTPAQWLDIFLHFASLSLLAVGGAITVSAEMHRYMVVDTRLITDAQFSSSISIAQASPGPNVLFVALMGWHAGLNLGGHYWTALAGLAATMLGILLPSTTLTWAAARWVENNRSRLVVRAFLTAMMPLTVALIFAIAWVLVQGFAQTAESIHSITSLSAWRVYALCLVCGVLIWRTKIHLLWFIAMGGLLGALGWV